MQQRGRGGGRKEKKRKKRRGGKRGKGEEEDVENKKKRRRRKRKRGGRPRSPNCFLFLVQGNNQQLGGRLEDELIFLIFGIGQSHFDKMKGSRDE